MAYNYKFDKSNPNKLLFESSKWKSGCFVGALLAVGALGLLIGLGFYFTLHSTEEGAPVFSFVIAGLGLIITSAALVTMTSIRESPHKLIFDNSKGRILVTSKNYKGEQIIAEIAYNEIEKFDYRKERDTSSDNAITYYHVYWQKKDQSFWDLMSYTSEDEAKKLVEELKSLVKIKTVSIEERPPELPIGMSMKKFEKSAIIEWRNRVRPRHYVILFTILVLAGLGFGIMSAREVSNLFNVFPILLIGIFAFNIYYIVNKYLQTYIIEISSKAFRYYRMRGGKLSNLKEIEFENLAAIAFDVKSQEVGGSKVKVMNHDELELRRKMLNTKNQLEPEDQKKYKNIMRIDIEGINVVDKINLERLLQSILFKKEGVKVL
ncbi:MAG TPA: hypothetical protein ACFCUD_05955 [Cyclobacteriaceae bacterium]